MRLFLIFINIICLGFLGLFWSCGSEKKITEPVIRPVRTIIIGGVTNKRLRTFSGVIKSGQEAKLSFKVAGTVRKIFVKVGQKVKAGTLLAQLDSKDYQLQVQQVKAGLDQARAQVINTKSSYERVRGLYENRNASKSQLDAARAGYESGKASVRSLEKQLEITKLKVSYTKLRAPVDGSIAGLNMEINENVGGGIPVILLTSGKKMEVLLSIPESLISKVKEGEKATIKVDAIPNKLFNGIIKEVGVSSTNVGSAFPVTVQIIDGSQKLRSGMSAEVSFAFTVDVKKAAFIVPSFAVGEDREGRYVFTVKIIDSESDTPLGIVERNNVTIGDITDEGLEIHTGLKEGDCVVTAGISRIKPGQKVKIQQKK